MTPLTEKLSEIKPPLVCSKKIFLKLLSKIKNLRWEGSLSAEGKWCYVVSKNFTLKSSSIHKQGLPYLVWMRVGIFQRLCTEVCISWFLITKPSNVGKCKFTEKEWCFLLSISFSQLSLRDLPFRNRQRNVSRFIFNLTVQMWLFWLIKRGNMLCRSKCWNLICCEQTKTNEVSTFWST